MEIVDSRRGSEQTFSWLSSLPSYEQVVTDAASLSLLEETEEQFSLACVNRDLSRAEDCIAKEDLATAEEIYVELWLALTDECRATELVLLHEQKIQLMLTYARFMESRGRSAEAAALLLCIWREYEFHAFVAVDSIVTQLKEVALLMKQVELPSIALSVFKKCWTFFKSTRKTQSSIYRELEQHITSTSKEVAKICSKASLNATTCETDVREMFDLSMSDSDNVSSTSIELCKALAAIYIEEERYSEAITCIKSVTKKSWGSFFSVPAGSCTFHGPSVELMTQLALCYRKQSRVEKAEKIYVQLYRSARSTYDVKHDLTVEYSNRLLQFFKSEELFSKAIAFQQELLVEWRAVYGTTHNLTIKTLYALGDLCRLHCRTHGYWIDYYVEIINNLNKGSSTCNPDAMRALIIVAESYIKDGRYSESIAFYDVIAATFFDKGVSGFEDAQQIQKIFERYQHALVKSHTDISVQIAMLEEYHKACNDYYGADAPITVTAILLYASACVKSDDYQREAIALYESALKKSLSAEATKQCKSILRGLYAKQMNSTTGSKKMMESAAALITERYQDVQKSYSCTHEITMNALSELATLYSKQAKSASAVKELRKYALRCLREISTTKDLMSAGAFLAGVFRSNGYTKQAHALLRALKMQVMFNATAVDRVAYSFLASFESGLNEDVVSAAELMAEYAAADLYFSRYTKAVEDKSSRAEELAAKLRAVLSKRGAANEGIEEEIFA